MAPGCKASRWHRGLEYEGSRAGLLDLVTTVFVLVLSVSTEVCLESLTWAQQQDVHQTNKQKLRGYLICLPKPARLICSFEKCR
jgi:hypothetical protein